ncbi:MAG: hypothetical protein Q4F83_08515 [Eubacteriales bacterium]|nr:hypothetical protein [Eubacteriales bacterium]
MMKNWKILICMLMLVLCMGIAASASTEMTEGVTIGVAVYNPDDAQTKAFRNYLEDYLGEAFDAEFIYSGAITSWEEEKAFVDQLHELGVKGIISSQSVDREAVMKLCEEYEMYYVFGSSSLSEDVFDTLKDNPCFLGTIGASDESEEQAGADMAAFFAEGDAQKVHSYLICTGGAALGNEMHRIRGLAMLEKLAEIYGFTCETPAQELILAQEQTEVETGSVKITILPGYPYQEELEDATKALVETGEYDTMMSVMVVNSQMEAIREAEKEKEMDIRVGAIDCFTEETYALFNGINNDGKQELDYLVGKYGAIIAPAFVSICNAYAGYAEDFREDGHAFRLNQNFWTATNPDEFNRQYALSVGMYENTYDAADMMGVMKAFNPDATFDLFKEFAER